MSASDYTENKVLDHFLGTASFPMPSQVYVALYTAAPSDAGGGTEVSGNGYARQAADFDAADGGEAVNSDEIAFPQASASWGEITHFALFDALSAGNLLFWGALTTPRTIGSGDQLIIDAGDLAVTAD